MPWEKNADTFGNFSYTFILVVRYRLILEHLELRKPFLLAASRIANRL